MSVVEELSRLGGVATRAALIAVTARADVERALAAGDVVVLARGRYALPEVERSAAAVHRCSAVLSHRSAALHWGWAVKVVPEAPEITLPKNRRLRSEDARGMRVHRAVLGADDVAGAVTSRERTLADCLRSLPFDEGLAVADSALREGFPRARLVAVARDARGPGSSQMRSVAALGNGAAANPFESVLRAIALAVPGLQVRAQVKIFEPEFLGRPDLVDETLRFTWEDAMFQPHAVRVVLMAAVAERTDQRCVACRST